MIGREQSMKRDSLKTSDDPEGRFRKRESQSNCDGYTLDQ